MALKNGVVVTRSINKPAPVTYDTDGVYESVFYYRPLISIPSFEGTFQVIFALEIALLTLAILGGALFIIFIIKSKNKYRCPRCRKQYCFKNEIPEYCTRCGAKLTLPKIKIPE